MKQYKSIEEVAYLSVCLHSVRLDTDKETTLESC